MQAHVMTGIDTTVTAGPGLVPEGLAVSPLKKSQFLGQNIHFW